jgi:transcription-repair coupling factor (superfamily II helicase)
MLTRLDMYQKLADLDDIDGIETIAAEFRDRFGEPPEEVENLLYAVRIKILGSGTGIGAITTERNEIVLTPFEGMRFEREKLDRMCFAGVSTGRFQVRIDTRQPGTKWRETLEKVVRGIV